MNSASIRYRRLLDQFLNGEISVDEFQEAYLDMFISEGRLDEPLFKLLDELFADVESFTADRKLLAEDPDLFLDEKVLRRRVRHVVEHLSKLKP